MSHTFLADFILQAPELILVATAILVVFLDAFTSHRGRKGLPGLTLLGAIVAFIMALSQAMPAINQVKAATVFGGMAMNDGVGAIAKLIILFTLLIGLMLGYSPSMKRKYPGEFHALILFATFGAIVLANAANLVVAVLGLEILSLPLYTLVAFDTERKAAREAGLKYLILGAFTSAFLALGCALYYVATGTLSINGVPVVFESRTIFAVGSALILAGMMFKGGILPFFAWSPDVYEGAPDYSVGLVAALAKTGSFILLLRLLPALLPGIASSGLMSGLLLIAAGTMLAGNLMALVQTNIKRLLAYSSVAHAGYMFLGLLAFRVEASAGVLFYLAIYAPVLVASFQIVSLFSDESGHEIKAYSGLAQKAPMLAIFFAIMLLSLAGFPPMSGFMAKVITFLGAVQGGLVNLVIFAMIVSLIGVYYYLRVIVYMFMYEPKAGQASFPSLANAGILGRIAFWVVAVITVGLGVGPTYLLYLAISAVLQLKSLAAIPIH